ncbi:autotransporter outer membrane beta-barrel domain-containing protein [Ruegeria sp. EL01]|jgi:outer membrane autotransporter protein|uniref:autotransporter outer membrane beta-barrel domain-containing protein n=1 Tax=Ruegeria sp. EL01 TaxID=2107578 RepID=UPI000EA83265|nr:autotransporter outer membrane beta-barrel domain-containing protein [Ruegeria sp. EL01]
MTKAEHGTSRPHYQEILLRGGRMTKHKGQVASFAPTLGCVLSGIPAIALGTAIAFSGGTAIAGNCVGPLSGTIVCSGPADPTTDISVGIISGGPVNIVTMPGFGIEPYNSHNAIDVFSSTQLTFTDTNQSSITGKSDGLRAVVYNGGDLSVTTTGAVTGNNFGIYARNYGAYSTIGEMTISAADVSSGSQDGIFARNNGTYLTITTSGVISGARQGIQAQNTGTGALSVSAVNVSGSAGAGISATNSGTDLSITSTGSISGSTNGIRADNNGSGALNISVANVTGTSSAAIDSRNHGTDTSITATGTVSGTAGISARHYGNGALTIETDEVLGTTSNGISAFNRDGTSLSITTVGRVTGTRGINALHRGSEALTISTTEVTGTTYEGIFARNIHSEVSIAATGAIRGGTRGIDARNYGTGALSIAATDVTGGSGHGIFARHTAGTDLSITTTGRVSGGDSGILAQSTGSGALTISAADVRGGSISDGVSALSTGTDLSITTSGSVISGARGIAALSTGSGAVTISAADVTGLTAEGILASNGGRGTDLSVTATGAVSGGTRGIYANNAGTGALTVSAADVTGNNGHGIYARNQSTGIDLSITTTGAVSGGGSGNAAGILARNEGSGALTLSVSNVTGTSHRGINATNFGTDLSVTASGTVRGVDHAIYADNRGTGGLTIDVEDAISTGDGYGINAVNRGAGALVISAANVTGSGNDSGLHATNYGTDLSITTTGLVTGNWRGVSATNNGTGDMTLSVADVTSTRLNGLDLTNRGANLSVTSTGTISAVTKGIEARNEGSGALTVSAVNVAGTTEEGIYLRNGATGTDLSVATTGSVSGATRGIDAQNAGSGALTIAAADVTGTTGFGINARNSANGTNLSITTTGTASGTTGIFTINDGSGAMSIAATDVTGTVGTGLVAFNRGTDQSITTTGLISGVTDGLRADNTGTGSQTISVVDVTGTNTNGIRAENAGTDQSITASGTVTGSNGILAANNGTGAMMVQTNNVTGTGGRGIDARNYGTDLSITTSGLVSGASYGIIARNSGSGTLTIQARDVTGSGTNAIEAVNRGSGDRALSVTTSGTVVGAINGIYARNTGSGVTSVTVSGAVSGGTGAGINTRTNTGGLSVITLNSGASVSSASGVAITNDEGNSQVTLAAGSAVTGSVQLNDGNDALTVNGGADISGGTLFDGGAGTQDRLAFSAFSGALDGARFTNWESTVADNGSALTLTGATADFGVLTALNGSSITAGDANLALGGALQIDATSRFHAGFGGDGAVSIGGDTLSNGLIRLADGQSGDRLTFGGNLAGAGTVALDVNFATGANDQIVVTGDSAGAQQGLQVEKAGNGGGALQNFTLATVNGTSTAGDFRLVNGDFVTRNGQDAVNDGSVAYVLNYDAATGQFVLSPFNSDGEVNTNPDRAFLAAAVQQFSDQIALSGALRRLSGRTGSSDANTVSRALIDLSTTDQPLFWLEAEGGRDQYTNGDRTNKTTGGGLRVGASQPLAEFGNGSLIGGLEFGATTLSTNSATSLATGQIDTDAYDLTASALWLADSQLYLDGQIRYAFFDSTTRLAGGQEVDTDGDGYAVSIEVGKFYQLNNGLNIVPQAQLIYSSVDADDLNDVTGSAVGTVSDGETLRARLGLRVERDFGEIGALFGQFDYTRAFDNETGVSFGNDTITTKRGKNNLELTLGGHLEIATQTMLFGQVSAQSGFDGSSDDHGFAGQIGLEFRF